MTHAEVRFINDHQLILTIHVETYTTKNTRNLNHSLRVFGAPAEMKFISTRDVSNVPRSTYRVVEVAFDCFRYTPAMCARYILFALNACMDVTKLEIPSIVNDIQYVTTYWMQSRGMKAGKPERVATTAPPATTDSKELVSA